MACSRVTEGKSFAELLQSLAALEVIEEISHRHAGAGEDRLPAHDLRVRMDNLLELHIEWRTARSREKFRRSNGPALQRAAARPQS